MHVYPEREGEVAPPIFGLPESLRPCCSTLHGGQTFWAMMSTVSQTLKRHGRPHEASQFLHEARDCDGDEGMLFCIALHFIRLPGQESAI